MFDWVLHHSLIRRAWSDWSDEARPAARFVRDSILSGEGNLAAIDLVRFFFPRDVAELVRYPQLDRTISEQVYADISGLQELVFSSAAVTEFSWTEPALLQGAFVLSSTYDLLFEHALSCSLAEAMGVPLLVGDTDLADSLGQLTALRPTLFVTLVDSLFE